MKWTRKSILMMFWTNFESFCEKVPEFSEKIHLYNNKSVIVSRWRFNFSPNSLPRTIIPVPGICASKQVNHFSASNCTWTCHFRWKHKITQKVSFYKNEILLQNRWKVHTENILPLETSHWLMTSTESVRRTIFYFLNDFQYENLFKSNNQGAELKFYRNELKQSCALFAKLKCTRIAKVFPLLTCLFAVKFLRFCCLSLPS